MTVTRVGALVALQPRASDTVTEYVPLVLTVMDWLV